MTRVAICTLPNNVSLVNIPDKESASSATQNTIDISEPHTSKHNHNYSPHPQSFPAQQLYQLTISITNESHSRQSSDELTTTIEPANAQPAPIVDNRHTDLLTSETHFQKQRLSNYQTTIHREQLEIQALSVKIKSLHLTNDSDAQQKNISKTLTHLQTTIDQFFDKAQQNRLKAAAKLEQKNPSAMIQDYAYGEFFFTAYKQAKKAQHLAKLAAQQLSLQLVPSPDEHRAKQPLLSEMMNQLVLIFSAKANIYLGRHAQANLEAHATYELNHLYQQFKAKSTPADYVTHHSSYGISAGAALPDLTGLFKINVNGKLDYSKTKIIGTSADGDLELISIKTLAAGIKGKTQFTPIASASGSLSAQVALLGDFYETDNQDGQGKARTLKYAGARKNDRRSLFAAKFRDKPRKVKNKFKKKLFGLQTNNQYLSPYANSKSLENAQGQAKLLNHLYDELDKIINATHSPIPPIRQKHFFQGSASFNLSMPAPASQAGTAKKTATPWQITKTQADITATMGFQHESSGSSASIEKSIAGTLTQFKLHTQLLQPTHALLSVAHTCSYQTSLQLAQQIRDQVWLAKSDYDVSKLPMHLRNTVAWIDQTHKTAINNIDTQRQLESAISLLKNLAQRFAHFENTALYLLALHSNKNHLNLDFFNQHADFLHSSLTSHQLLSDQLANNQPHHTKKLKQQIAQIWDTYSSAIGIIDVEISQLLGRQAVSIDQQFDDLKAIILKFAAQHQQLAQKLDEPQLPFLKDTLYRYSTLIVNTPISKSSNSLSLSESTNMQASNLHPGIGIKLFELPAYITRTNTNVEQHPNPLRKGQFTTIEKNLAVGTPDMRSRIANGLWKKLARIPGLNKNARINTEVLHNLVQSEQQQNLSNLMTVLGLASNTYHIKEVESRRNGTLQMKMLQVSDKKGLSLSTPNLIPGAGADLKINTAITQTQTTVANHMMGPDLAYHVLSSWKLENYGINAQTITQATKLLQQSSNNPFPVLFKQFFDSCTTDLTVKNDYFGLNGIGGLLRDFSELDPSAALEIDQNRHKFSFMGFDAFKQEITQTYFERTNTAQYAAKKLLGKLPTQQEQDIFKKIGIRPDRVGNLLAQIAPAEIISQPSQTVFDFLTTATPEQRQAFYQETEIGKKLFVSYLSIINTAREIKNVFRDFPVTLSSRAVHPGSNTIAQGLGR